ncbi:MAG: hypothetical protein HY238_22815 [Acidobacteria bacterium]|nr:hypothetical protein [Acidobacteriota bacterium]
MNPVGKILLAVGFLAAPLRLCAEPRQAPRYLCVFLNTNHFLDPSDEALAVEAYRGFEEVCRRHGVTIEPFFTGLSFRTYRRNSPELMEGLKKSGRDWHHHGANRPPFPQLIDRVGAKPWEEATQVVWEYERYALDPTTGTLDHARAGGLEEMVAYFGRPPLSTGRFFKAPIMAVCRRDYGVKMGIGTHDWFTLPSAWLWYMGTLNRPDDVFVHPGEFMTWARQQWAEKQASLPAAAQQNPPRPAPDIYAKVEQRLAHLDPEIPAFAVFGFHDGDLFGHNRETGRRFPPEYRKFLLERVDEFLTWAIREKGYQPITFRQVYQMARSHFLTPRAEDAIPLARQIIDSVERRGALPLSVTSPRGAHSLVEAWQLLAAALAGKKADYPDILGPTRLEPKAGEPVRLTAEQVRAAARALAPSDAIPTAIELAGRRVNAAEFLYLMAKTAVGAAAITAPPLEMFPAGVAARDQRFSDPLSMLQMWTYKPAYFGETGGRLQNATSVEVNIPRPR